MNIATKSVSMWPASASSAIEPIVSAVVSSMTKKADSTAAAMIIRLTRVSPLPWLWPAPMPFNVCAKTHMSQGAALQPGRPEPGEVEAESDQAAVDPGQVEEPADHGEEVPTER